VSVLRFDDSDLEPEYDDDDSYVVEEDRLQSRSRRLFGYAFAGILAVMGFTYTANIVINGGSSLEFGQGQARVQQVACDANGIEITPLAGFINEGNGKWSLDSVYVENIDSTCAGKDFVLNFYTAGSNIPLTISETSTGTVLFNKARIYFQSTSSISLLTANSGMDVYSILTPGEDDSTEFASGNGFVLVFDANMWQYLATSSRIDRITIQSSEHNPLDTN